MQTLGISGTKLSEPSHANVVCAKKRQENHRKALLAKRLDDFYEERFTTSAGEHLTDIVFLKPSETFLVK